MLSLWWRRSTCNTAKVDGASCEFEGKAEFGVSRRTTYDILCNKHN
jgi:hypothetical protein